MEIYRDDCLSLPEQVQENKYNVNLALTLFDSLNMKKIKVKLNSNAWMPTTIDNETVFKLTMTNPVFQNDMFFCVTCDEQNENYRIEYSKIFRAESAENKIVFYTNIKPNVDINIEILYNYIKESD